ncbi:MAG TPA: nucleotidyl transferase AbiEii/AbiGii toxin family protein [Longimicrobiales bacterium]|nr:nucleotidyl transferase AbiEii/AbiGii toxin family protein [Longimicrobiales bacterium]
MRASEFLSDIVRRLESAEFEYALVGSIATMSYGEPRATLDVDVVIAMTTSDFEDLQELFPAPEFYLSPDAAREAVRSKEQFNVIHPGSGMKVDFFVSGDAVEASQIRRRLRRLILPGIEGWCSPPEELIVKKLSYYQQGASDKHLRDIASMIRISPHEIDVGRVREMAGEELGAILDGVLEAAEDD